MTKLGGVVVWIVGDATVKGSETGTSFKQALYFKEIGFNLHDTMIWDKGNFTAVGSLVTRYAPTFEYMFILSKGKPLSFNPIKDRQNIHAGTMAHGTVRNINGTMKKVTTHNKKEIARYGIRHNVWRIPNPGDRKVKHPATFSETLASDQIISWSNPGDTVLDPMCGSGTTCKMAKQLGRKYIGIDISSEYCAIARERIGNIYESPEILTKEVYERRVDL